MGHGQTSMAVDNSFNINAKFQNTTTINKIFRQFSLQVLV